MANVEISLDAEAGVLYVKIAESRIHLSLEAASDSCLILNTDEAGEVIGLQALYASEFRKQWRHHPARALVPTSLVHAIDNWATM